MRISDWSSDVCSSDLLVGGVVVDDQMQVLVLGGLAVDGLEEPQPLLMSVELIGHRQYLAGKHVQCGKQGGHRSEEHTSELQSLMRISYAVFCLKKKNKKQNETNKRTRH